MADNGHQESFTTSKERLRLKASRTLDASEKPDAARMREQELNDLKYQKAEVAALGEALEEAAQIEPSKKYL